MTARQRAIAFVMAIALLGTLAACKQAPAGPKLTPKVAPPVIGTAGVLKLGTDLSYPPFGGKAGSKRVGIDVDVAAAIAQRLGLQLEVVDVKSKDMASALNSGKVDIVLGATSIGDAITAGVSNAGIYLNDGPAIFGIPAAGSAATTVTAQNLTGMRVGVQKDSASWWKLESDFGQGFAQPFGTLREALDALKSGTVDYVVGDAAVGAYIARDFSGVTMVGQYGAAQPMGISVRKDATGLESVVRESIDALAADGTLDTIHNKWMGNVPKLEVDQGSGSI